MKKTMSVFKIAFLGVLLALGAQFAYSAWSDPSAPPPGGNTEPPVNVGTTLQVKNGGLSVNAFTAYMNSLFKQDVTVEQLKTGTAGPHHVCADGPGKLGLCSGAPSPTPCPAVHGGYSGAVSGDCVGQVEYYASGSWVNVSYSNNWSICSADGWKNIGGYGDRVTVTNTSSVSRNYLVVGQAFVGNDSGNDVVAYMLKEGNESSSSHTNVIGFDQGVFDYSPPNAITGRPSALQVTSVETIAAGQTKIFNGWVYEVFGGCGRLYGMKTTAVPL